VLAVLQREFEGEATLLELEQRVQRCARAERDEVARRALLEAADARTRGDLEAAVVAIEQVDVRGLSREVSKLVFGRWSDACSRLAQTAGASLVRFAPAQGRGLILYEDPANANALPVFSSLGMGPGFPQGKQITDPWIIERARSFDEAAPPAQSSWLGQPAPPSAAAHH